jgi:hypothetical protein
VVNRSWRLSKGRWASPFGCGQVICTVRDSRRLARTVHAVHGQPRQRTRTCPPDRQFSSAFPRLVSCVPIWDVTRLLAAQPLNCVPIWDATRLLIAQPLSCVSMWPARSNLLRPVHPSVHQPVERVLRAELFHDTLDDRVHGGPKESRTDTHLSDELKYPKDGRFIRAHHQGTAILTISVPRRLLAPVQTLRLPTSSEIEPNLLFKFG